MIIKFAAWWKAIGHRGRTQAFRYFCYATAGEIALIAFAVINGGPAIVLGIILSVCLFFAVKLSFEEIERVVYTHKTRKIFFDE